MNAFTRPVDAKTATAFLTELQDRKLSYHPDDDAHDCLSHKHLADEVLDEIDANMKACFAYVDPYQIVNSLLYGFRVASDEVVEDNADLYQDDDVAVYWEWNGVPFAQLKSGEFIVLILHDTHTLDDTAHVKRVIDAFLEEEGVSDEPKTLREFVSRRKSVRIDSADQHMQEAFEGWDGDKRPTCLFTYPGGAYIAVLPDGRHYLPIEQSEHYERDLSVLEPKLFEWWKAEVAEIVT